VHDLQLHRALLGQAGSRTNLNTPVLVLDRAALTRNISRMAEFAASKGVALRPHAKTHKSADIARMQLAAGAAGICCAKLGEAEVLAEHDIGDILITSPVVPAPAIRRLVTLNARIPHLKVVVDSPANVAELSAAMGDAKLEIIIDIDPGIHRTGVASADTAAQLLRRIRDTPNLVYKGVQYYCGLQQHITTFDARRAATIERTQYLESIVSRLAAERGTPEILTGGGTGTHRIDAELGVLNEWQVGSYVFMDHQYAECDLGGQSSQPFEYALFVESRVVSANTIGLATIDAGFKSLSTDGGTPDLISGAPHTTGFLFMGDEHGAIFDAEGKHGWQINALVRLAVPHCDPTVNLYDYYHVVDDETLVDIWPVTARGRSR
jgi:3-hydroxy-D-aspartate aldolase